MCHGQKLDSIYIYVSISGDGHQPMNTHYEDSHYGMDDHTTYDIYHAFTVAHVMEAASHIDSFLP